ncbi:head-tail adaptor protein [Pararhizobium polonicum]|uniref:Head-tail adaptor protein n=1 Tax=Pararhizobium polonicum TaxID=1612624 RepID=A0A1C7P491_9HYPH|nr:phage head closure protein [Pararhizobium polonicum]OBZ96017.1 head-tail adaptor protein [Pararhizobium polonicum]
MGAVALDPGQMSARLDLEMRDDARDGQGGIVAGFAAVASLWARIEPVALAEEERADAAVFTVTHRIWIRFREDLAAGMRFRKGGRIFTVRAFYDPDETGRYVVCRCVEERP